MNDNDLERQLRSQRGPREAGYNATNLPAGLEQGRSDIGYPSRLVRMGAFAGMALAGALAVALLGGVFSGGEPGVGSSPSASDSAQPADCGSVDVTLAGEPWGGAAGSRGTTVTVTLASGRGDCMLPPVVGAEITGGGLVELTLGSANASEARPGVSVLLSAGAGYTAGVAWSNWCGVHISEPVTLALRFYSWPAPAPVTVAPGGIDPVPPCMGNTEESVLSWTALEPQP